MRTKLDKDASQPVMTNWNDKKKRKHKSMTELRDFTSTTRKSKKGCNEIMGWSTEGKLSVHDVFNEISQHEELGICEKWEKMYKTLCEAVKQSNEKD
jgi:CRISPR/Cas system CSM-associated protein Csm4 (group 5 of RAMP superfamily)